MSRNPEELDKIFQNKFKDFELNPSSHAWEEIKNNIPNKKNASVDLNSKRKFLTEESQTKTQDNYKLYWLAASVIFLVGIMTVLIKIYFPTPTAQSQIANNTKIDKLNKPVKQIVTTSSNSVKNIIDTNTVAFSRNTEVSSNNSLNFTHQQTKISYSTAEVKKEFTLPDGSKIFLNKHSNISFDKGLENQASRIVYLNGEAFFSVKHLNSKPFIIYTKNSKTEVLGTSFNLKSSTNQHDEIDVVSGKVAFTSLSGNLEKDKIILIAGQKATLNRDKQLHQAQTENPNFIAWKDEKIVFEKTRLINVISTLEDYFSVSIIVENSDILDCNFTGTFEKPNLEEILEVLTFSTNLHYSKGNNHFIITGKGCKSK